MVSRRLACFVLALLGGLLFARDARASCRSPEYCVCAPYGDTVVDAVVQPGTGTDTVWLEVLAVSGVPLEGPSEGVIELPRNSPGTFHDDDVGRRVLAYVLDGVVMSRVLITEDDTLECDQLNEPVTAEEGTELALMGWEDCIAAVQEREGLPPTCDDTAGCAVANGPAPWAWMFVVLLGLGQRRYARRR